MTNPNQVVSILLLVAIIAFGSTYYINTMGAVDNGVDMSGSAYEDQYNASQEAAQQPLSILIWIPMVLVAGLLIKVVKDWQT